MESDCVLRRGLRSLINSISYTRHSNFERHLRRIRNCFSFRWHKLPWASKRCLKKSLLIRILKRDSQLHLFRRFEKCSERLVKCEGSIEFLRLCVNFGVTPTFAQVERSKARKWKKSADNYQKQVLNEELRSKLFQMNDLRNEVRNAYKDVKENCSMVRFIAILQTLVTLRRKQHDEMMRSHINKMSRLISKKFDVNEHIDNRSSYRLSFFEKLVICRGLKFSLPQKVSSIEVLANFEKAYWKIEPSLKDPDMKELASSTLRSIALNYIQRASPNPPKALVKALNRLKKTWWHYYYQTWQRLWSCSSGQRWIHTPTECSFNWRYFEVYAHRW